VLEGPAAEVPVSRRRQEREDLYLRSRVDGNPHEFRRRRPPARPVVRGTQHRRRLERQHLHDRDVRGTTTAEVRLQGPRSGNKEGTGRAVAVKVALASLVGIVLLAQTPPQPTNDLPNPYRTIENYFKMPEGRKWGSTSGVAVDRDGKSIWVAERCGANTCLDSKLDPILKFDATGALIKSFGAETMVFPHGLTVDRDGNIWVTDGQDNRPRRARGAPPDSPLPPAPSTIIGHQVFKYSPDGKLLLTLGKQGGGRDAEYFSQPNALLVPPNAALFVSQAHAPAQAPT